MRVLVAEQKVAAATAAPPRGSLSCLLVAACAYSLPLGLLCLRLWHEMQDGSLPTDGRAVLVRFVVVGLFSLLFSRWCLHWMRRR
jgi:hypothetical protein